MDKVTQQNAANAEESASASEELNAQAESLQDMVQEFTLSNSGSRGAAHRNVTVDHNAARKTQELVAKHHGLGQSEAEKAIPLNNDSSNSKNDFEEFNS